MPKSVLYDEAEVIHRVTNLFWEKGYHATSMQDIVDVSGLNRSSLYNSFGDKYRLFEVCLHNYQGEQTKITNKLINKGKSGKESLVSLFIGIKNDILTHPNKGCFLSNCLTEMGKNDGEVRNFLIDNKDGMISTFSKLIRTAQLDGEIDKDKNAEHLALFLFSNLHGLRLTGIIESDNTAIEAITEQVLQNL